MGEFCLPQVEMLSKVSDSNWFGINGHNHDDSKHNRFNSISLLWNRTLILRSRSNFPLIFLLSDLMFSLVVMPFNRCCSILKLRQNCTEFIISAAQKSNFVKLIFYVTWLSIFLPFPSSLSLERIFWILKLSLINLAF